jgi:hypothetical protein
VTADDELLDPCAVVPAAPRRRVQSGEAEDLVRVQCIVCGDCVEARLWLVGEALDDHQARPECAASARRRG